MNVTLLDIQSLTLDFPQASQQSDRGAQGFPFLFQQNLQKAVPENAQAIDFNKFMVSGLMPPEASAEVDAEVPESRWQAYLAQAPIKISSDLDQVSAIAPLTEPGSVASEIQPVELPAQLLSGVVNEGQPLPVDGNLLPPNLPAAMPRTDVTKLQAGLESATPATIGLPVDKPATLTISPANPAVVDASAITTRTTESLSAMASREAAAPLPTSVDAPRVGPEAGSRQASTEPALQQPNPPVLGNEPASARPVPVERAQVISASMAPVPPQWNEKSAREGLSPTDPVRPLGLDANIVKGDRPTASGNTAELTALRQAIQPRETAQVELAPRQNPVTPVDTRAGGDPVTEALKLTLPPARAGAEVANLDAGLQRVSDASLNSPTNQPAANTATVTSSAPAATFSAAPLTPSPQPGAPLPPQLETLSLARSADSAEWGNGIGERVSWMINQKLNTATIRLDPPTLGKLDVQVKLTDDATTITIQTQHAHARDLIESASLRLRDFLQDSGFQNVNVDVSQRQDQQQSRTQQFADNDANERDGEFDQDQSSDYQQRDSEPYFVSEGLLDTFA